MGKLRQTHSSEPAIETFFSRIALDVNNPHNARKIYNKDEARPDREISLWLRAGLYPALSIGSVYSEQELRKDFRLPVIDFNNIIIPEKGEFLRFGEKIPNSPKIDPAYWPQITKKSLEMQPYICIPYNSGIPRTRHIYFPCTEIGRYFYLRSSLLSRQALIGEEFGKIRLSSLPIYKLEDRKYAIETPFTFTPNEAATIASIALNPAALIEWESFRRQILINYRNDEMDRGIETYFPQFGTHNFSLRGKKLRDGEDWDFMVTEIVSTSISLPFDDLIVIEDNPIIVSDKSINSENRTKKQGSISPKRGQEGQVTIRGVEPRKSTPDSIDLELDSFGGMKAGNVYRARREIDHIQLRKSRSDETNLDEHSENDRSTGKGWEKDGPHRVNVDDNRTNINYFGEDNVIIFFSGAIERLRKELNRLEDEIALVDFITGASIIKTGGQILCDLSANDGPLSWIYLTRNEDFDRPRGVMVAKIKIGLQVYYILEAQRKYKERYCTLTICHSENARPLSPGELDDLIKHIADRGLMGLKDSAMPEIIRSRSHHKPDMDEEYFASRLRAAILSCKKQLSNHSGEA